jgi:hypothetical protein
MNPKPIEQANDPLLARILPALLRARQRAEELAAATDTAIIDWEDGKIVRWYPGRPGQPRYVEEPDTSGARER